MGERTYTAEEIKENRRMWVEALESGNWTQRRGSLFNATRTGHCCLGVACEVLAPAAASAAAYDADAAAAHTAAYAAVRAACGLTPPETRIFIAANDEDLLTFAEIAQMVRALPEPV